MVTVSSVLIEKGLTKPRNWHNYETINKKCSKCGLSFPRTSEHFRREKKTKDGLSYLCKTCSAKICKDSYNKNIEKRKAYNKSPEFIYKQLKYQAKKRNIVFTLSFSDYLEFLAFKPCHYCGDVEAKHWIDRYINDHNIGYTLDNCVPACEMCNKMKSHHNPDTFIKHCKNVANFNKA